MIRGKMMSTFKQSVSLIAVILYHIRRGFVKRLNPVFLFFEKIFKKFFHFLFAGRKKFFAMARMPPRAENTPARIAPTFSAKTSASESPVS